MEKYTQLLTELNSNIWDFSELKFCEYRSAQVMIDLLRNEGFSVKVGLAGMDTAFTAAIGNGHPVIGLLAEFDALSGLSQCADIAVPRPRGNGKRSWMRTQLVGHRLGRCSAYAAGLFS